MKNRMTGIAPDKADPMLRAQAPQEFERIEKPPFLYPMNREEAQRMNGMRQMIMNSTPDQTALRSNAANYGVGMPQPKFKPIEQALMDQPGNPEPTDGMPVDPNDGGMAAKMAMVGQLPQPGAMPQQSLGQNPMQKQGLAALMARLGARTGGF